MAVSTGTAAQATQGNMESQHDIASQLHMAANKGGTSDTLKKVMMAGVKQINWYKLITKGLSMDDKRTIAVLVKRIEELGDLIEKYESDRKNEVMLQKVASSMGEAYGGTAQAPTAVEKALWPEISGQGFNFNQKGK
jgi:hypothetical protein